MYVFSAFCFASYIIEYIRGGVIENLSKCVLLPSENDYVHKIILDFVWKYMLSVFKFKNNSFTGSLHSYSK